MEPVQDPTITAQAEAAPEGIVDQAPQASQHVPKERFDEVNARLQTMEAAFQALGRQQFQQQSANTQPNPDAVINQIANQLGAGNPQDIREWNRFLTPFIQTMFVDASRPYVQAIEVMADKLNNLEARVSIPDYSRYTDDIDRVRVEQSRSGKYLSHTEAYHLVRSQRLPEILQQERDRAMADRVTAQRSADTILNDSTGSVQTTAPSLTKSSAPLTREQFAALSPADKEQYLDGVTF